jgi:hypothetical protein
MAAFTLTVIRTEVSPMRSASLAGTVVAFLALCPVAGAQVEPVPATPAPVTRLAAASTRPVALHVGAGLGMPYGAFGFNVEALFGGYFAVTGGLGHTVFAGPGWSAGVRGYLLGPGRRLRLRATVIAGSAFITDRFGGEQKAGLSLGAGGRIMFGKRKRHGIDTDLLVTVYPSTSSVEDEWGGDAVGIPVKISVGYVFGF